MNTELTRQLAAAKPKLLICLGSLSWKAFLLLQEADQPGYCARELGIKAPGEVKVPDIVGRYFWWRQAHDLSRRERKRRPIRLSGA